MYANCCLIQHVAKKLFQAIRSLPINHWDYCLTNNQHDAGQETNFLARIRPKTHQQLSFPELTKNRRVHNDLYVDGRLNLPTRSIQTLVNDWLCLQISRNPVCQECPSSLPVQHFKHFSKLPEFFQTCGGSPATHPAKNVVRRKMLILFFSG